MNRSLFSRLAAAAVVVSLSLAPVPAQAKPWEEPKRGDTAADAPRGHARPMPGAKPVRPRAGQRAAAASAMALPACETSKYTDPTGTGVLRVDQGCDLDRYMYESDGPLDFSIVVDRYAGPVTAEGYPAAGHTYTDRKALLTLRAWDVDDDYAVGGEVDRVGVNGHAIDAPSYGILTGAHDQWSTVSFHIDASKLKFPAAPGEVAVNDFSVLIDTANPGTNTWAVSIDWAELRLSSDVLPVALMHGIISTGEAMQDMKAFYEENVWQLAGKIITPSLTFNGSTYLNELMMRDPIAALKRDTGAEQINLVAHSMGGLNSRRYAWLHPGDVRNIVMIGTPNGGSPVADHLCEIKNSYDGDPNEYEALILIIGHKFGACDGPADGLFQLQTSYMQNVFNVQVRDHAAGTEYATIAGEGWDLTSIYVPGQSDGVVAVDSVRWMDRNGSHGGVHTSLEPIFPQNHGDLIKTGSGALGRSLCHAYAAQYACYRVEESSGLRAMAGTAADPVELADIGTATIRRRHRADPARAGGRRHRAGPDPHRARSHRQLPGPAAEHGSAVRRAGAGGADHRGAGTVTLHNSTGAPVKAAAVGSVATTRQLAVAGPAGLPTAGSPVTATMTLTEAVAGEQVRYRVLDGAGAEVVEGVATGTGAGTWSATFTPAGAARTPWRRGPPEPGRGPPARWCRSEPTTAGASPPEPPGSHPTPTPTAGSTRLRCRCRSPPRRAASST
ncbi:alpha/beta fold hydrolase [Catellatospora coxensis]